MKFLELFTVNKQDLNHTCWRMNLFKKIIFHSYVPRGQFPIFFGFHQFIEIKVIENSNYQKREAG